MNGTTTIYMIDKNGRKLKVDPRMWGKIHRVYKLSYCRDCGYWYQIWHIDTTNCERCRWLVENWDKLVEQWDKENQEIDEYHCCKCGKQFDWVEEEKTYDVEDGQMCGDCLEFEIEKQSVIKQLLATSECGNKEDIEKEIDK